MKRRDFLKAMVAAAVAPAIVRAESLMPIWVPSQEIIVPNYDGFDVNEWHQISIAHFPEGLMFYVDGERVSADHPLIGNASLVVADVNMSASAWVKGKTISSIRADALGMEVLA